MRFSGPHKPTGAAGRRPPLPPPGVAAAYSAIVILPYTSRIQGVAGRKIVPGRRAQIRLSSYSALVTAAAVLLYRAGVAPQLLAVGEATFGPHHPSTAALMRA